jgi:hypothetical protein
MPNRIVVDVTPPRVKLVRARPSVISPDGDGRADRLRVDYLADEAAQVSLYVDGVRRTLKRGTRSRGAIEWDGRLDGAGAPPGHYRITIGATDVAGNVSRPSRAADVLVRYVVLGRRLFHVAPGGAVVVTVRADAESFRWRLGKRTGTGKTGLFRVSAPRRVGRFPLLVTVHGHSARATVIVRATKKRAATTKRATAPKRATP